MAISFDKHYAEIIAAWKDVLDDKSSTTWVLYGYEGQTNELKVVARGEGDLNELNEDLNSGKIMYAFVRFEDPKTCLKKFLLINWQGEGAPILRKGTCANHIRDVANLLTGTHMTINARNEDDIDLERVLQKLNTVGSSFDLKETRANVDNQKTPVGTNYKRVIPNKELNAAAMQNFWKKEEEEEKRRIATDKETKRLQQFQLEKEQRAREEKEHLQRENILMSANLQPTHVPIKTLPQPLSPEKSVGNLQKCATDADRMRQQRNQEAREVIGSRVEAAKAIFTQQTSEKQLHSKLNINAPTKPVRNSISQRINAFNKSYEATQPANIAHKSAANIIPKQITSSLQVETVPIPAVEITEPEIATAANILKGNESIKSEITDIANNDDSQHIISSDDYINHNEEQYSTIKRSPHSKTSSLQSPDETASTQVTETVAYQDHCAEDEDKSSEEVRTKVSVTVQQSQSTKNGVINAMDKMEIGNYANEDDFICSGSIGDLGMRARALYDYQAADESEITFDPGDIISHIDQIDEGWWQGLGPDGTFGLFPANYVQIID